METAKGLDQFGWHLKAVLKARKISQEALARRLQCTQQNISLLCRTGPDGGPPNMRLQTLLSLANAIGCTPYDLLEWKPRLKVAGYKVR